MTFSVVIPARYASTRLPGKPLLDIAGLPMIAHVAQRARDSGAAEVIIATDHAGIMAAATQHGHIAEMTRPDHASGTDRIAEIAQRRGWGDDHVVVNVQGDEPLIEPALIRTVAGLLAQKPQASMATACCLMGDTDEFANPNIVKVVLDREGYALYFSRAPIPHMRGAAASGAGAQARRHIGIYAYRAAFLREYARLAPSPLEQAEALEQLRALWHGHRIAVAETTSTPHAGVDTVEDLERVRKLLTGAASRVPG